MLAGAPAELRPPEPAKKKGKGAKGESAKAENEDPNSRRAVEGRKGSKFAVLPSVARPPREERKDRIDHLTEAEFALLPKYIIGRMTREKLNQSIDELNALVADKYTLLKLPAKSLSKAQRDRAVAYRDQERPETRDRCFVTEGEVRDTSKGRTRNDPAGKTVLAILRTTGRLKEVRGGGHNRLVIV
ncbi:hypothetical protein DFJ74DRAFT_673161 [Hyaloraphidium curvatum]|nr:hypothetical protein DFJ74DRAFT_673161 [Hyaloraphidium curvatum]